jgi:hypothetical protein
MLIIIGALTLIIDFFTGLSDINVIQFSALALIVIGIPVHIYVSRREYEK